MRTTAHRSAKKRPHLARPRTRVVEYVDTEVDYTPESRLVHPRGIEVKHRGFRVTVEEGRVESEPPRGILCVGLYERERRGKSGDSIAWLDMPTQDIYDLFEAAAIALSEAKKRGFPNLPTR